MHLAIQNKLEAEKQSLTESIQTLERKLNEEKSIKKNKNLLIIFRIFYRILNTVKNT